MFFTFVWGNAKYDLAGQIPLESLCASVAKKKAAQVLNIVFLEGMDHVPQHYLNRLQYPNVNFINYEQQFVKVKEKYHTVFQYYSRFESYCFLRWICLKEIAQSRALKQIWHIDSDVVFHVPLDEIAQDTAGKTFMLEGCPVLASISHKDWFEIYEAEFRELLKNPSTYSATAFSLKAQNRNLDHILCNQSLYRNPIGSDQDLLQYLIGSCKLPQEEASKIFSSSFFYVQNPLQLNDWHKYQGKATDGDFVNVGNGIMAGKRRLAFTHFQGNFVTFCNLFYFLNKCRCPHFLIQRILSFTIINEKFLISSAAILFRIFLNRTKISMDRSKLVKAYTADNNGYLLKVMNFLAKK